MAGFAAGSDFRAGGGELAGLDHPLTEKLLKLGRYGVSIPSWLEISIHKKSDARSVSK